MNNAEKIESTEQELEGNFVQKLYEFHLLKPKSDILDIGCNDGFFAHQFQNNGHTVDAIDIYDRISDKKGIYFEKESFVDYIPNKQYDVIFARNVFFQEPDPIGQAKRYMRFLKPQGLMYLSLMGEQDDWSGDNGWHTVPQKELDEFKNEFHVLWFQEIKRLKSGLFNPEPKNWHLYKMILQNKV